MLGDLDREGPLTPGELAARRRVRQQSMTTTLDQLATDGYVTRAPHPDDGRKTLVQLSEFGAAKLTDERRRRSAHLAAAIATALTPDEQAALADALPLLKRVAGAIER